VLIIILQLDKAHLGVRMKREGFTVIAADWKKQEYFEEVEQLNIDVLVPSNFASPINRNYFADVLA
jgi:hypothetical protein